MSRRKMIHHISRKKVIPLLFAGEEWLPRLYPSHHLASWCSQFFHFAGTIRAKFNIEKRRKLWLVLKHRSWMETFNRVMESTKIPSRKDENTSQKKAAIRSWVRIWHIKQHSTTLGLISSSFYFQRKWWEPYSSSSQSSFQSDSIWVQH